MSLVLTAVFIGNLTLTSYRSVPGQTDDTPNITSIGEKTSIAGVAVSQDLLCPACLKLHRRCDHPEVAGHIHYGDCLFIESVGLRVANDVMGKYKHYSVKTKDGIKRLKYKQLNWLDIWMTSYKDEHDFHTRNGFNKHPVYIVKGKYETTKETD